MSTSPVLNDQAMDIIFRDARTYNGWKDEDVSDVLLKSLYELMKFGPTSANCSPLRIKFVKSEAQKEKLKPHLMDANVEKTMTAPVTAVLARDMEFYEHLPDLFPHTDAKSWFEGDEKAIRETATRNATLQGAYFIIAARAVGLDCGPMSGFDTPGVKEAFFPGENVEIDFLCNLGYGDPDSIFERSPRFKFDEVCEII